MKTFAKGQPVAAAPGYVVLAGGEYADMALVECARAEDPETGVAAFLAAQVAGTMDGAPTTPGPVLSRLAFRMRFTLSERIAIDNAALPPEQQALVRTVMRDFDAASEIHLLNPDVIAGVRLFEQLGLITPGRADEILRIDQ